MLQDLPKWERPREKLIAYGARSLSNSELIALLISSGTADESAISVASKILALEDGNLTKFSYFEPEEFMTIKGIGIAKACTLVAAIELGRRIQTTPATDKLSINDPGAMAKLFIEDMRYLPKEYLRVVMLDCHSRVIGFSDISIGGISDSSAHPREVFSLAVKKGAAGIIIAHNHPSGECSPSNADITVTKQIADSGRVLDIKLVDHLIIGDGKYSSMRKSYPELFTS